MIYTVGNNAGAASTTAATAGLIKVDNPDSAAVPLAAAAIMVLSVGPAANAEDSNYAVRLKRQSTRGGWTAVTARAHDGTATAISLGGVASTSAGTAGNVIGGPWGFNQRGGLMVVAVPGAEWVNAPAFSNGLILEYVFAQGTAVNCCSLVFRE